MRIVADENIPLLQAFFEPLGEVVALSGRDITAADVKDADVLLVRSVTPVNEDLLAGSRVRLVGTATIGCDHVDQAYLAANDIAFFSAPGCNAQSVVEYVLSALSILCEQRGFALESIRVGIVGRGAIGSRLERLLKLVGVGVKSCDPPLAAAGETGLYSLDEVLECDVVSVHVPLTQDGSHPTRHMINAEFLSKLGGHQILVNSSRGQVMDEQALKSRLLKRDGFSAILDVWWNEPEIDPELARLCVLATPHIAGYSLDGRTAATEVLYQKVCGRLGIPIRAKLGQFLPEPPLKKMHFSDSADPDWVFHTAIRACLDLRHDHALLLNSLNSENPGISFDYLRKTYRQRRGFQCVRVKLKGAGAELNARLKALGFSLSEK